MRLKRLSTVGQLPTCLMISVIFNPLRQIIFFCGMVHSFHQELLQVMKSTHAEDGVNFSIWQTPFGGDGLGNTFCMQLQQPQQWFHKKRNLAVGDIVLIVDDRCPRSTWPLGRIVEIHTSLQYKMVVFEART